MAQDDEFIAFLLDPLQLMGPVVARRMFGGAGLFLDGVMFALVSDRVLYFKVDASSVLDFEALGLPAFQYPRAGKMINLSYHQAPEQCLDDRDALVDWANRAYAAARRAAAGAGRRRKKPAGGV